MGSPRQRVLSIVVASLFILGAAGCTYSKGEGKFPIAASPGTEASDDSSSSKTQEIEEKIQQLEKEKEAAIAAGDTEKAADLEKQIQDLLDELQDLNDQLAQDSEEVSPDDDSSSASADGDGDGVSDAQDQCPTTFAPTENGCPAPECTVDDDCGGGKICTDSLCVAPEAVTVSLNGTKRSLNPLGLVEVHWHVTGPVQDVVLYGSFNRSSSSDDCGKPGSFLAVASDGKTLTEDADPASDYQKYKAYATGEKCTTDQNGQTNCPSYGASQPFGLVSNFGGALAKGLEEGEGKLTVSKAPLQCRISLKALGESGVFYTRTRQLSTRYTLAAQSSRDGHWEIVRSDTLTVPSPRIKNVEIQVSQSSPEIHLSFDYANALYDGKFPTLVTGCTTAEGPVAHPTSDGSGGYARQHCAFKPDQTFNLTVYGFGAWRTAVYRVACDQPNVQLTMENKYYKTETGGEEVLPMNLGWVPFNGKIERACRLEKKVGDAFQKVAASDATVPWVKSMSLFPIDTGLSFIGGKNFNLPGDLTVTDGVGRVWGRIKRSYVATKFVLMAKDFDGTELKAEKDIPYLPSFKSTAGSWGGECHGMVGSGGVTQPGPYMYKSTEYTITFEGQHIQEIQTNCPGGSFEKAPYFNVADPDSYRYQTGWKFHGDYKATQSHMDGNEKMMDLKCSFTAYDYAGKLIHTENVAWSCHGDIS